MSYSHRGQQPSSSSLALSTAASLRYQTQSTPTPGAPLIRQIHLPVVNDGPYPHTNYFGEHTSYTRRGYASTSDNHHRLGRLLRVLPDRLNANRIGQPLPEEFHPMPPECVVFHFQRFNITPLLRSNRDWSTRY
ncbi:hypothetical protein M422DRAFT_273555 [Sphaerobolus stellatus SS14]|uniref:Uncharacterized protein n=1 Tax=Sphaerobolus stellatus (strain SS14) TaxID=990650 RepID=A0A0C9T8V4_SPHS4|nr:hypothetical protein M422DRAFT_273555 [Sphaerobolus stellatus SS14]